MQLKADNIRANLNKRLIEERAVLQALENVNINTGHKKLTNKAVMGASVVDYIGINKALKISYTVKYDDNHTKHNYYELTCYSYSDKNGVDLGSENCIRISRTLEPVEVLADINKVIEGKKRFITELKAEYKKADTIAKKHNELINKINNFNNNLSYACGARISFIS